MWENNMVFQINYLLVDIQHLAAHSRISVVRRGAEFAVARCFQGMNGQLSTNEVAARVKDTVAEMDKEQILEGLLAIIGWCLVRLGKERGALTEHPREVMRTVIGLLK